MQNLFYIKTVPHSGTNFVINLIRELADNTIVHSLINPDEKTLAIRQQLLKVIDKEQTLEDCLYFLGRHYDNEMYNGEYENIFIAEHLPGGIDMPVKYKNMLILPEFKKQGYPGFLVKTLVSLRDYRKVLLTIFLLTVGFEQGRKEHLAWSRKAFEHMLKIYKHKDYMVIPIDLYGNKPIDKRIELIYWLFDKFLCIRYNDRKVDEFAEQWKPVYSIFKNKKVLEYYAGNEEFELLMSFRKDDELFIKQRKEHAELDAELKYYDEHLGIREMYRYFGYEIQ